MRHPAFTPAGEGFLYGMLLGLYLFGFMGLVWFYLPPCVCR